MAFFIQLTPEQESRLEAAAKQEGIAPEMLATKLVTEHLPSMLPVIDKDPTVALFTQWEKEDALKSPQESVEEARLWEAFEQGINESRHAQGMRLL